MEPINHNIHGLARVIFDEMLSASATVENPAALWTPANLAYLEGELRHQLAPSPGHGSEGFFNFVFDRSFHEARDMMENVVALTRVERRPYGRAMAMC